MVDRPNKITIAGKHLYSFEMLNLYQYVQFSSFVVLSWVIQNIIDKSFYLFLV